MSWASYLISTRESKNWVLAPRWPIELVAFFDTSSPERQHVRCTLENHCCDWFAQLLHKHGNLIIRLSQTIGSGKCLFMFGFFVCTLSISRWSGPTLGRNHTRYPTSISLCTTSVRQPPLRRSVILAPWSSFERLLPEHAFSTVTQSLASLRISGENQGLH